MVHLSPKEAEVLSYVIKGFNNKQISEILCISLATVKAHITSIMRKFNVENRTTLTYVVLTNNILDSY